MKYLIYSMSILLFLPQVKTYTLERPVPESIKQILQSQTGLVAFCPGSENFHIFTEFERHRTLQNSILPKAAQEIPEELESKKTDKVPDRPINRLSNLFTPKNCMRAFLTTALVTAACLSYHEPLHKRFLFHPKPTDLSIPVSKGATRVFGLDDMLIGGIGLKSIIAICEPLMLISATLFAGWKLRKWAYGDMIAKKDLQDAIKKIAETRKKDLKDIDDRLIDMNKKILATKKDITTLQTQVHEGQQEQAVMHDAFTKISNETKHDLSELQHSMADFQHTQEPINAKITRGVYLIEQRLLPQTEKLLNNERAFQLILEQNKALIEAAHNIINNKGSKKDITTLQEYTNPKARLAPIAEENESTDQDSKYEECDPTKEILQELQASLQDLEQVPVTPEKKSWWSRWHRKKA